MTSDRELYDELSCYMLDTVPIIRTLAELVPQPSRDREPFLPDSTRACSYPRSKSRKYQMNLVNLTKNIMYIIISDTAGGYSCIPLGLFTGLS